VKNYIDKKLKPWKSIIRHMKNNTSKDGLWTQMAHNKFTWEEFESESIALLIAGFESSSNTLCYTLQLLSQYPDVTKKLKQEIDTVLGGTLPTFDTLKNLHYLEKVILEAIRFQLIVIVANRVAVEQDKIGDYIIPKGYQLFTCPGFVVRNSFDDPDTFNPDRFTEENIKELSKKIWFGFGGGPHRCIGLHLAKLELKLTVAFLIQNGSLEVDPNDYKHNPHFPVKSPKNLTACAKSINYSNETRLF